MCASVPFPFSHDTFKSVRHSNVVLRYLTEISAISERVATLGPDFFLAAF